MSRVNGLSFDIRLMGFKVEVESFTMKIEDNSTTSKTKGRPSGKLQGDVSASGELVIDIDAFKYISLAAAKVGSYQELPSFPIDAYATGSNASGVIEGLHVHAYECFMKIEDLLNVDTTSTDKSTVKIGYEVAGKDFVDINGVPYLKSELAI